MFRVHGSQCHGIVNTRVGTLRPRLAASAQAMSKLELDVAAMRRQRTAAPDGLAERDDCVCIRKAGRGAGADDTRGGLLMSAMP